MTLRSQGCLDVFLDLFETVATKKKWPQLVQSLLVGKAQYVLAALDGRSGLDYKALKDAVLAAYRGVPTMSACAPIGLIILMMYRANHALMPAVDGKLSLTEGDSLSGQHSCWALGVSAGRTT